MNAGYFCEERREESDFMHLAEKNLIANDVVRYSVFLGLLLIFLATNSILFGILFVCMGIYFVIYEWNNRNCQIFCVNRSFS